MSSLNINEITPLTPEIMSKQATINIGTIGHVAHGKSTVVKAISGVQVYFIILLNRQLNFEKNQKEILQ